MGEDGARLSSAIVRWRLLVSRCRARLTETAGLTRLDVMDVPLARLGAEPVVALAADGTQSRRLLEPALGTAAASCSSCPRKCLRVDDTLHARPAAAPRTCVTTGPGSGSRAEPAC